MRIPGMARMRSRQGGRQVKFKRETISATGPMNKSMTPSQNLMENNALIYEQMGGLFNFMLEQIEGFMTNQLAENIHLSSILIFMCSQPVRIDLLDGTYKSTTSPYDSTHEHLTYLHMILLDQPLLPFENSSRVTLLSALKKVHKQVEEFLKDRKIAQLVSLIQEKGEMATMTVPMLNNALFMSTFDMHRKKLFNCAVFIELIKAMTACLAAK